MIYGSVAASVVASGKMCNSRLTVAVRVVSKLSACSALDCFQPLA